MVVDYIAFLYCFSLRACLVSGLHFSKEAECQHKLHFDELVVVLGVVTTVVQF